MALSPLGQRPDSNWSLFRSAPVPIQGTNNQPRSCDTGQSYDESQPGLGDVTGDVTSDVYSPIQPSCQKVLPMGLRVGNTEITSMLSRSKAAI